MPHNVLHRQIYAGLMEILKDSNYYYHNKYSTLKDPGKEEIIKFINMMAYHMIEEDNQQLTERAKKIVWENLKN